MNHDPLRIAAVEALPNQVLRVRFEDGFAADLDLRDWIANTAALSELKNDALFATGRVGEFGTAVVFIDDVLDLGADNLRNLAIEQAGGIGNERLLNWMADNGLTQERAAEAIGISRRMLNYYLSAAKPIPQTVWLACVGWASLHKKRAHAGKRSPVASSVAA